MAGARILSDKQINEMASLRERGWSYQRIADHFTAAGTAIRAGCISWQCLRVGADVPARMRAKSGYRPPLHQRRGHIVRPYSPDDDAQLLELEAAGHSFAEIARRLGRKPNSVRGRMMTMARNAARQEEAA